MPDSRPAGGDERVEYTYRDEAGDDHHRVTVTGHGKGKKIFQHRWDGSAWQKGRPERLILYRLPEILGSSGVVYVVEGERDVETLRKRGLVATTSAMGAGSWRHTAACAKEHLEGRDIVIIRDLDDEGLKYARDVEATVRQVAKSVRMLEPTRGKDITDHLSLGGTLEELVPVTAGAPATALRLVKPPPPAPPSEAEVPWSDGEPPSGETDGRPEIVMGPDIHRVLDELERHMATLDPGLYQRGRELVTVLGADGERGVADGTPVIRPLSQAAILPRITSRVAFVAVRAPSPKAVALADARGERAQPTRSIIVPPTTHVVQPLLSLGEWPTVRLLRGVTEAPCLRGDGTILQTRGYDPVTRYLYAPNAEYLPVPDAPTQAEAVAALRELRDLFVHFPFADGPGSAGSVVAIAALLTVLARPAIDGPVPAFVFEASVKGAGKTLQCEVVHVIATGRPPPHGEWPVDEEEQKKAMNTIALTSPGIVVFDNVKGTLGGAALEAALTSERVSFRRLGGNVQADVPWQSVVLASGNQVDLTDDMVRRTLIARLEPAEEDPTTRTGLPDLKAIVRTLRTTLVRAALIVLRAYACHGFPDADCRMASFEAWARIVPGAIRFAGGPNVLAARATPEKAATDATQAAATVVRQLAAFIPTLTGATGGGVTTKAILAALYPPPQAPDGWDDLREAIETLAPPKGPKVEAIVLGKRLRKVQGRWFGSGHIAVRLVARKDASRDVQTWVPEQGST